MLQKIVFSHLNRRISGLGWWQVQGKQLRPERGNSTLLSHYRHTTTTYSCWDRTEASLANQPRPDSCLLGSRYQQQGLLLTKFHCLSHCSLPAITGYQDDFHKMTQVLHPVQDSVLPQLQGLVAREKAGQVLVKDQAKGRYTLWTIY